MSIARQKTGEIGTALAVLALYLLVLLAPLHHARASQLALEQLGYTTLETGWALCTPAGVSGADRDGAALSKCPATAAGKAAAPGPALEGHWLLSDPAFLHVAAPERASPHVSFVPAPPLGPRGPPSAI